MKNCFFAFATAVILASGAVHAHDYHSDRDRHSEHGWDVPRLGCDYSNPWAHERNHRPHRRTGGAGPCHDIHRGDYLPRFYWHQRYALNDWRGHDLPAPWRDHHWVRTGNDFAMVHVHSARISKVVLLRHRKQACRLYSQC